MQAAKSFATSTILDKTAVVTAQVKDKFIVLFDGIPTQAKQAASCLLTPNIGDLVGIFIVDPATVYITHVLERDETNQATIRVDNGLDIISERGSINLQTLDNIGLIAGDSISSQATNVNSMSSAEKHHTKNLQLTAEVANVDNVTTTFQSKSVVLSVQNMLQNLANSIRNISKTEQLQATNWITKVSDTHTLSAKNSVQVADGELKLDAKRIHMG